MMFVRLIFQTVFLALGQIWSNKIRSILTTLGIMIGVAAVVVTVAAITGLKQYVLSEFETFGAKKVYVDGTVPQSMRNQISWGEVQLKPEEVQAIVEHCPSINMITPHWYGSYDVTNGIVTKTSVQVIGIWPQWHDIEDRSVTMGRPFTRIDDEQHLNVCLINDKAIEELDLDRDPVGDTILIHGRKFMIIGVVETKDLGPMFGGGETRTEVFVPFTTAQNLNPYGWLNYAVAEMTDTEAVDDVKAEIRFVLRSMRGLDPEEEDTFETFVIQQTIDQFNGLAAGITAVVGAMVAVSLLVGGIGIMNIMLVSVSERTREIGLRKAVGARPSVVLTQFLIEAVVLCLAGAGVGLGAASVLVIGMQHIPDFPLDEATIPAWAIALSAGFSIVIGVVFGMFPAIKAARLSPIDALRHE